MWNVEREMHSNVEYNLQNDERGIILHFCNNTDKMQNDWHTNHYVVSEMFLSCITTTMLIGYNQRSSLVMTINTDTHLLYANCCKRDLRMQ